MRVLFWGLGYWVHFWGLGPIPNPQSPIPNIPIPKSPVLHHLKFIYKYYTHHLNIYLKFKKMNIKVSKWRILNLLKLLII